MTDISFQIAKYTQLLWLLHRCRLSRTSLEAGDYCAFISQHRVHFRGRVNVRVIRKVDVRVTRKVKVRVTEKANVRVYEG